jgi:hypothetical protein
MPISYLWQPTPRRLPRRRVDPIETVVVQGGGMLIGMDEPTAGTSFSVEEAAGRTSPLAAMHTAGEPVGRVRRHAVAFPISPLSASANRVGARASLSATGRVPRVFAVFAALLGVLALAALLNADHLLDRAEKMPYGSERDFWVATWEPVQRLSDAVYLNRPRQWLDQLLDRELNLPAPVAPAPAAVPDALPAVAAPSDVEPPVAAPIATATPATPPRRLRVPTKEAPLRLWVGGDSMAAAFGGSLARLSSETGLISPTFDARASTGLTRPDFFDWGAELRNVIDRDHPDVIVVIFGANDAQGLRAQDGKVYQPGTDGWSADYRRRVAAMMDMLAGPGRLIIWVGQPVMAAAGFSARMAELNDIYRDEAGKRDGILFFESWALFVNESGSYSAYLKQPDGTAILARDGDGIHLTKAGADRLATAILERLNAETPILPHPAP